jgi:hypothetical protein
MCNKSFEACFGEAYKKPHSREMSEEERQSVMKSMSDNFDAQDEPKVGIFWYDAKTDELFGVTKTEADGMQFNQNGLKTVKTLHKTWWQKQKNRIRSKKGEYHSMYEQDYTHIPRGRIFQRADGVFQMMCGSWINEHIEDLVKDEFDLQTVPFERTIDEHWEIDHGWNEDYES